MRFEADLEAARARIADGVVRTPVWRSDALDEALGCAVWLKCEPLQRTGSFKLRGATNAVRALPAGTRGVVAVSSGNHAQAVAYAGRAAGLPVTVVMNADANAAKRAATLGYGATVVSDGVDPTNREEIARELAERDGPRARAPVRRLERDRGAGHRNARAARGGARSGRRRHADRRRRPALGRGAGLPARLARDARLRRRAGGLARRAALARRGAPRAPRLCAVDDRRRRAHGADRRADVRGAERAVRGHRARRRRRGAQRDGARLGHDEAPDRADLRAGHRRDRRRMPCRASASASCSPAATSTRPCWPSTIRVEESV